MAQGNMIVTLVANASKFVKGMRDAGGATLSFGDIAKRGIGIAVGAFATLATALFTVLPNFIKMGEEARKSELRLQNITKQMGLFGKSTEAVTSRISKYAEKISFATGVDDELVRSAESILMTFKEVGKSANKVGGNFDRATMAAVDLAAAGFGEVESNAIQLGKALQDPITGLTALRRAGVTFTQAEQDQIAALVQANDLYGAQSMVLSAIEKQVGGTAEATASATDKMSAKFESIGETLSEALLPAVDEIAGAMTDWLDSVEGKKAVEDITNQLLAFGDWLKSPKGTEAVNDFMKAMELTAKAIISVGQAMEYIIGLFQSDGYQQFGRFGVPRVNLPTAPMAPGSGIPSAPGRSPVTVNVTGITPTAKIGTTVMSAIQNAQRLGAR